VHGLGQLQSVTEPSECVALVDLAFVEVAQLVHRAGVTFAHPGPSHSPTSSTSAPVTVGVVAAARAPQPLPQAPPAQVPAPLDRPVWPSTTASAVGRVEGARSPSPGGGGVRSPLPPPIDTSMGGEDDVAMSVSASARPQSPGYPKRRFVRVSV
jgi:hypothetical protein